MKILTAQQMQLIDRKTSEVHGVPSLTLMENAGFHLLRGLETHFDDLSELEIAIVCGKGNNGGDGMVLARQLLQRGISPDLFLLGRKEEVGGDAGVNLAILDGWGHPVFEVTSETEWDRISQTIDLYDVIVDAMLGTGISKPLGGLYLRAARDINDSRAFVLSVDIPSGIFSDSTQAAPESIMADLTVTFTAPKIAHILGADQEALGELLVGQIGTPPQLLDHSDLRLNLLEAGEVRRLLLPRPASSHKGSYGHCVIVAGSRGKSGAAGLCSAAALRAGAGLVTAVVPDAVQATVAGFAPEVMTQGMPGTLRGGFQRDAARPVLAFLADKDAAGLGPGLTTDPDAVEFVHEIVHSSPVPLILDADGLNAFEGRTEKLRNERGQPLILTPHPGEFSRLTGIPIRDLLADQVEIVSRFCGEQGCWVVLKTFRPLVGTPGGQLFVSPRGNPGMATAGTGDVLTGILTSIAGQYRAAGRTDPEAVTAAVCLALYLHGLAGDLASSERGTASLVSSDLIEFLPEAFEALEEE